MLDYNSISNPKQKKKKTNHITTLTIKTKNCIDKYLTQRSCNFDFHLCLPIFVEQVCPKDYIDETHLFLKKKRKKKKKLTFICDVCIYIHTHKTPFHIEVCS